MTLSIKLASKLLHRHGCNPKSMSQVLSFPEIIPNKKSGVSSCKSLKLMLQNGYIKHSTSGIFSTMPLAVRSLEKLVCLVDVIMSQINGQKVLFPALIQESLMKTSGRWDTIDCLFKLKDRGALNYCLGPTHEEIVSSLMAKSKVSYKSLPVYLYQISTKFRDEKNPKLGLLRGREFVMKDMYSFDSSEENSRKTYETVCNAYENLFKLLGVDAIKVQGSGGDIGGDCSHEFHLPSSIGEDELLYCHSCKQGFNAEVKINGTESNSIACDKCKQPYTKLNGIEVGHAFLLGTTYSKPFNATFDTESKTLKHFQMGCFGLGITRIMAASVECLSTNDRIRWPLLIAPYLVSVISPKRGSKESNATSFANDVSESLCACVGDDVLLDDRSHMTIGRRVQDAQEMGIPYVVVAGKKALEDLPKLEIIDTYNDQTLFLTHHETMSFFRDLQS